MNNIRKALRYIYIYILTHANAGWAYDRQPREVWERKRSEAVRNNRKHSVQRRFDLLHFGRRAKKHLVKRGRRANYFGRCGNVSCLRGGTVFAHCKWESGPDVQQRNGRSLSSAILTSKEVAA